MSTLLVDELYEDVVFRQPFKILRDINIAHIRAWIYKQGTLVDGDLTCEVYDGATLLATTSINYSVVNAAFSEAYAHGFVRFDFRSLSLRLPEGQTEKEYFIEYSMKNHTTDDANYIGITRRWEEKTYQTYGVGVSNGEAPNDSVEPSGLELFVYDNV